jgi:hypothetical protein
LQAELHLRLRLRATNVSPPYPAALLADTGSNVIPGRIPRGGLVRQKDIDGAVIAQIELNVVTPPSMMCFSAIADSAALPSNIR